jgi:diguanylate cyclase (GGDEF)-like protein
LNQYISKPWDETQLLLGVENLLRQYRLAHENAQLIASLSAKNQALLEMNRELEAKIHERTHELAEANTRLAQLAVTDGLTGLYNHRHFHERLALEVERSQRSGLPLSLLMLDVDNFKQFNDTFGHPAGDEVLRQLARVLADTRRANDVVARYGGEEFAVILVDTAKFTAAKVADRIRERVIAHDFSEAVAMTIQKRQAGASAITVSFGVATFAEDGNDAEALVRSADTALYAAKRAGRNRVVLYTDALGATPSVG